MAIDVGQPAPAFTLKDQDGADVSLGDFAGKQAVALVFYPFTFTGICEGELCALRDDLGRYEAAGVQVLAVSCDSKNSQKVWAEQQGYTFPLLSDFWPHGATAQAMRKTPLAFQVLAFGVPLLLLGWAWVTGTPAIWPLAFASQAAGLLLERWFFFAQARHPQNIYYQAVS